MTDKEKIRIYFDMDGTLAVFHKLKTFEELLEPGYFKNLTPNQSMVDAAKLLTQNENFEVFILSAYLTESKTALNDKQAWVDEHLPEINRDHRIFVPCGTNKSEQIPTPSGTDILIDDYTKNLKAWHGIATKVLNGINNNTNRWEGPLVCIWQAAEEIASFIQEFAGVKKESVAMG